jgi:site-specific recombinase XerC
MTDECISPLRRRMIEDMTVRNFVAKTQTDYIRRVKNFAVFLGRSPDTATREDVRRYLLHLASSRAGAGTVNGTGSALRFFFDVTLDRADIVRHLPIAREPRKAPIVLSPEEVARMLEAAPGLKYKAALSVAYGAGLRVSEVVALKVSDIDSGRMMIRIGRASAARTATRCCRRDCSGCYAIGGWFAARGAGCSRAVIRSSRSPRVSSPAPAMRPRRRAGSTSLCLRTRCGTALPRIYWSRTSMFA